ncbi:DNA-directed RNA polymerase [Elsinoe australis]|uniref:DNA-directed RNA polymerase n=1 Tax=Elsinoe australis TaxID=40998 RepID=A0A4U7AXQ5_9PEZI|nr:DNA-directed RNA polymerase [Elsinoe australis]
MAGHAESLQPNHHGPVDYGYAPPLRWDYPNPPSKEDLLMIQYHEREQPRFRRSALGNNSHDLLQNLYACIRVGRFDRAEGIIRKLIAFPDSSESEVMHAHEVYLGARLENMSESDPEPDFQEMAKYFSKYKLDQKTDATAACLLMIRAALLLPTEAARTEEVKRFARLSQLDKDELEHDVDWQGHDYLILSKILNDQPVKDGDLQKAKMERQETEREANAAYRLDAKDIPEILQVQQRGLSLDSLKNVLSIQERHYAENPQTPEVLDHETEELRNTERERLLEDTAADAAVARWKAEDDQLQSVGINSALSNKSINALMWRWYSDLLPTLRKEIEDIKQRMQNNPVGVNLESPREDADIYGAFVEPVSPEKLAVNAVIYVMSTISQEKDHRSGEYMNSIRIADAAKNLGNQIEAEVVADLVRKEKMTTRGLKRKRGSSSLTQARANARRTSTKSVLADHTEWPLPVKVKVGAMLISKLVEVARIPITREHPRTKEKITRLRPAFLQKMTYVMGKRQNLLSACPELRDKMRREPVGGIIAKRLPMLTEPVPWSDFKTGGYLNYTTDFIRIPANDQTPKDYAKAAIQKGHMKSVFDAINALSKTSWRINNDVLRVQIEAWNTGEPIGNLAPADPKFDIPPEPSATHDAQRRAKWLAEMQEIENKKTGYHSQRCHQNLQLEIARSFRNDKIYFPHNIDFRSRAYPIPPYLNHMGADNVRGLMIFGEGKELGKNGLRWLKIHLANVYGYDKASFSEREQFVMDHLDDIYDSVDKPLTGRKWWQESEDAWQTLAACFELKHALETPDPTTFVSRLPVQQDGSCNGLQHYASLGGDEIGARQVNLVPGDRPSDVYSAVAERVIASVEKDLKDGNPIAKILKGRITRKVVKQPVMTNVYGVTYFGARQQVKRQLEDIFPEIKSSDLINHQTLAAYIARKIFDSLGEMFRGAQAIQEWLSKCADRIATSVTPEQIDNIRNSASKTKSGKAKKARANAQFKSTVIWTTPLRFPVVQPYRDAPNKVLKTALSSVLISEPQVWDPVSRRRQLQGFPPNFIHSLDATHMMLSAIKCEAQGITFASIHDSFWTHACDRDELSELLRDAFVHMHREDIVGRLKEEFETRYKDCMYLATVDSQSPIAKKIMAWRKSKEGAALSEKFGKGLGLTEREMIMEYERTKLLKSDDAKDQEKGRNMITPAVIFEQEGGWKSVVLPVGLASQRLGHAPEEGEVLEDVEGEEAAAEEANSAAADGQEFEAEAEAESVMGEMAKGDAEGKELNETQMRMKLLGLSEGKAGSKAPSYKRKFHVWLPLAFPDVPQKGSFDVTRLRESKYFFH